MPTMENKRDEIDVETDATTRVTVPQELSLELFERFCGEGPARPILDAERKILHLRASFITRLDYFAAKLPNGGMTVGAIVGDEHAAEIEALIEGHVLGLAAEKKPRMALKGQDSAWRPHEGPVRVGMYCIDMNNTCRWMCVDFDGGAKKGHPLKDPLSAALACMRALRALGIAAYLERSGGGSGWHLWIFFDAPMPAWKARRLGIRVAPKDAPLAQRSDGPAGRPVGSPVAMPEKNIGIEIFPKQERISPDGLGNQVWLPWCGDIDGEDANQFVRVVEGVVGEVYVPETFDTVTEARIDEILNAVPALSSPPASGPPSARARLQGVHTSEGARGPADAKELLEVLLDLPVYDWAIESADTVSREAWRGIATNIAAAVLDDESAHKEGASAFHEISKCDPRRYDHAVTEKTWGDALKSAAHPGPMTYGTMKANGVPDGIDDGGAKAPVAHARNMLSAKLRTERALENPRALARDDAEKTEVSHEGGEQLEQADELNIFKYSQTEFLFDVERGGYLMKATDPLTRENAWKIIKPESFNTMLVALGLPRKQLDDWKMHIHPIHSRRPLYAVTDETIVIGNTRVLNTYEPTRLRPVPGDWKPIADLFLHLVGGEDEKAYEYVLDWIASPLQKIHKRVDPAKDPYKMGTGIVLKGDPGAGKGTAMNVVMECYGLHNCVTLGQDDLDGRFHANIVDKLFIVADEVMSSSNRSMQTANKLKKWVTEAKISVEGKYADAAPIDNNFNIVFTSNDERPLLIEKKDRRYSVFESSAISTELIQPIIDDLHGDKRMVAAFYDHLLQRDVKMRYGDRYETTARVQVQNASAPTSEQFAAAIEEDGFIAVAAPWIEGGRLSLGESREPTVVHNEEVYVLSDTLLAVYKTYCSNRGIYAQAPQALTAALKRRFPSATPPDKQRVLVGHIKRRAWRGLPNDVEDGVTPSDDPTPEGAPDAQGSLVSPPHPPDDPSVAPPEAIIRTDTRAARGADEEIVLEADQTL